MLLGERASFLVLKNRAMKKLTITQPEDLERLQKIYKGLSQKNKFFTADNLIDYLTSS